MVLCDANRWTNQLYAAQGDAARREFFDDYIAPVFLMIRREPKVLFHCKSGMDRSPLMLAGYLLTLGFAWQAIVWEIRKRRRLHWISCFHSRKDAQCDFCQQLR